MSETVAVSGTLGRKRGKTEVNKETIDAARKALEGMKKASAKSMHEVAMELDEEITALSKAGYSYKKIADRLRSVGIPISVSTLAQRHRYEKTRQGSAPSQSAGEKE
jgi:hypothetical protein